VERRGEILLHLFRMGNVATHEDPGEDRMNFEFTSDLLHKVAMGFPKFPGGEGKSDFFCHCALS